MTAMVINMKRSGWLSLLGAVLAIMPAGGAMAEKYLWQPVVIGGGGYVPGLVFSRAERDLAYLRTDIGGAYRWDAAQSRWVALMDGMAETRFMGVESLAPDPVDPARIYAAVGMYVGEKAAILASSDRGRSWRVTPVPFAMGGNEDGRGLGERLAIDPRHPETLLFGSRHDGLWRSMDRGQSWQRLSTSPYAGQGAPARNQTHGGVGFVVFDPHSDRVVAGVADSGHAGLWVSHDRGDSWTALPAGPAGLLPVRADFDADGTLYVVYDDWIGPNGVGHGAIQALAPDGAWRDITPPSAGAEGGFGAVAADPANPGVLVATSLDRWHPGDTVWRSRDGGRHWVDLAGPRDATYSPFLDALDGSKAMGHWMTALAIDPFAPGHVAYGTGATVMAARNADQATPAWQVWTQGVEETAPLALDVTSAGTLVSGLGDIGGFVHQRLDRSPPVPFLDPFLPNTNAIDHAGLNPAILVRSGTARHPDPATVITLALSRDGGQHWAPIRVPALKASADSPAQRYDVTGDASIVVGADGGAIVVNTPIPLVTRDDGKTWAPCQGLTDGARVIADKVDPALFYAIDFSTGMIWASNDRAASFAQVAAQGLPVDLTPARPWGREAPMPLVAAPGHAGELWLLLAGTLWHSRDGGKTFATNSRNDIWFGVFGLGAPARGSKWTTLYAWGGADGKSGLWRSIDGGGEWLPINDADHRWGGAVHVIAGNPAKFGEVYVGAGGRGIFIGAPAGK